MTVSKENFDKYLDNVLAPRLKDLDDKSKVKTLAYEARKSHDGLNLNRTKSEIPEADLAALKSVDDLFLKNQREAIRRSYELQQVSDSKSRETFSAWLQKKKDGEKEMKKVKDDQAALSLAEKMKRETDGKKAYKKWMRLRRKNSYRSKAENVVKVIPEVKRADHYNKGWNKDVDLAEYYGEMENNFL